MEGVSVPLNFQGAMGKEKRCLFEIRKVENDFGKEHSTYAVDSKAT